MSNYASQLQYVKRASYNSTSELQYVTQPLLPKQMYLNGVPTVLPSSLDLLKLVPGASPRAAAELWSRRSRQPGEPLQITYKGESPQNKRLSPNRKAFFKNIKAFCHIAHDGAFHLANKPEICVFSNNWTLTAKTQSDPFCAEDIK